MHGLVALKGVDVGLAESTQARFRINLCTGNVLVPQELLDMIEWHAGVEEERGHAGAEPMGCDLLLNPRLIGRVPHDDLDVARRVLVTTVALEQVAAAAPSKVGWRVVVEQKIGFSVRGRYPLNTGEAGERLHEPHPLGAFMGGQARHADPLMGTRGVLVLKAHQ